jgi:hypothetical protein
MRIVQLISMVMAAFSVSLTADAQETISAKFRMLSIDGAIDDLALVSADAVVPVEIPELRRSDVYAYRGSSLLRFVIESQIVEREPLPNPVLEVSGVDRFKNALILVFRLQSSNGVKYQALAVADDFEGFPGGTSRFVNISPYPLLLLFDQGSEPQQLESGKVLTRAFESENQNVHIQIASYADGEVHRGLDDRIFPKAIHRDIYFIFEEREGQSGRVKMRRLREHQNSALRLYQSDG